MPGVRLLGGTVTSKDVQAQVAEVVGSLEALDPLYVEEFEDECERRVARYRLHEDRARPVLWCDGALVARRGCAMARRRRPSP